MGLTRRGLIGGLGLALAAPAIVTPGVLMRIRPRRFYIGPEPLEVALSRERTLAILDLMAEVVYDSVLMPELLRKHDEAVRPFMEWRRDILAQYKAGTLPLC
jgi:hypothetical protein